MKQIKYTLLVWLAAFMLFPAGVGATDAEVLQKDLKIQDVSSVTAVKECNDGGTFQRNARDVRHDPL